LCDFHENLIEEAASMLDEEALASAISRANKAGLGPAHPIIERGKQQLSHMQRERTKRERRAREVESLRQLLIAMKIDLFIASHRQHETSKSSESSLSSSLATSIVLDEPAMLEYEESIKRWDASVWLAEAGSWEAAENEIVELQKTLKRSKLDLGELHFVVLAAYNRIREMRDALHRAQYKEIGDSCFPLLSLTSRLRQSNFTSQRLLLLLHLATWRNWTRAFAPPLRLR